MKSWKDIGFEVEMTGDGSPSLHLLSAVDPAKEFGESMHHSGGACSETNLIYGEPIKQVLANTSIAHFMVVGLGLGYIEMVIAREALLAGKTISDVGLITSFESVLELRQFFISWLNDKGDLSPEIQNTYDLVLESVLKDSKIEFSEIKKFLQNYFKKESDIQGALNAESTFESQYHCILYDAFSSKTSPHLWSEDFLNLLLEKVSSSECVISTYACRGTLKRALKNQGFEVVVREGFQGKRNSTLGIKKAFKN